ncbi:hypothetical protein LP420_34145 [Massilia sp. B-10]|nr:hypothetical protein LP420_34145 [Massilia sp. B-10]
MARTLRTAAPWRCAGSDTQEGQKSKDVIPRLRIRMYRHGLGDCMLLRFRKEDGEGTYNVLIDCGLITVASEPQAKMQRVALISPKPARTAKSPHRRGGDDARALGPRVGLPPGAGRSRV